MRQTIFLTTISLLFFSSFVIAQKINFIIQVNEKVVTHGISGMYIIFDSTDTKERFIADYIPGDLTFSNKAWEKINIDSSKNFYLHFDYKVYKSKKESTVHFFIKVSYSNLKQPYMILNVYDFRDKKYRRWYQPHTKNNFLAELNYPGHGIYIRDN